MGGRITGLRALKSGRVAVYLDGRRAFRLTAVEAARLRPGQVLTDEEIRQLLERDLREQAQIAPSIAVALLGDPNLAAAPGMLDQELRVCAPSPSAAGSPPG